MLTSEHNTLSYMCRICNNDLDVITIREQNIIIEADTVIIYDKEIMFLEALVCLICCLFICLFVCWTVSNITQTVMRKTGKNNK